MRFAYERATYPYTSIYNITRLRGDKNFYIKLMPSSFASYRVDASSECHIDYMMGWLCRYDTNTKANINKYT